MPSNTKLVLVSAWQDTLPPLGLGYLAAYLEKQLGFTDVEIVDTDEDLERHILDSRPAVLGFSAVTPAYPRVLDLIAALKPKLMVPVILGGPHVTSLPHKLHESVDVGVVGEGEATLVDLMRIFLDRGSFPVDALAAVPGIVFHRDGAPVLTPRRPPLEPIDDIPFPKRTLTSMDRYLRPGNLLSTHETLRCTSVVTSRGCPYHCVYCQVPSQWGKIRHHSAEYVADEIEHVYRTYAVEGIVVVDDLFVVDRARIRRLIELLRQRGVLGRVKFLVDGRSNLMDEELMLLLKELGVVIVALGIESASDRVLAYLKKNSVTVAQQRNAVRLAARHGIGVYGQFMVGAPGETRDDMLATLRFIEEEPLTSVHVSVVTPLPSTPLWDECRARGLVTDDMDWRHFNMQPQEAMSKHFCLADQVPRDEFERIFHRIEAAAMQKHLKNKPLGVLLRRAFCEPWMVLSFIRRYLAKRLS